MDLKRSLPHHTLSSQWKPHDSTAFKRARRTRSDTSSHDTNDPANPAKFLPLTTTIHVVTPLFTPASSPTTRDIFRSLAADDDMLSFRLEQAVTLEDPLSYDESETATSPDYTPTFKLRMRPSFDSNPFHEGDLNVDEISFVDDTACHGSHQVLQLLPSRLAIQEEQPHGYILDTPRLVTPPSSTIPTPPPMIKRQRQHDVLFACTHAKAASSSLSEELLLPTLA